MLPNDGHLNNHLEVVNSRMSLAAKWLLTISISISAFAAMMSHSPTQSHRLLIGMSLAFMILFNGWIWSVGSRRSNDTT